MSYVFGPVPSRRLGRSLGVDLVPYKACSYDCIYCQLGRTTLKTVERKEWVPFDEVVADLCGMLDSKPDYITLSGSGEPTLYSRIGDLIECIRSITDIPVAILTNGSLLWCREVREQLLNANLVIPSLDASDQAMFSAVNRPHDDISFEKMLEGLIAFSREFHGLYQLEVFVLGGYSAIPGEMRKIADFVRRIKPASVHLNTVIRPPAEEYAKGAGEGCMKQLSALFDPPAEIIADFHADMTGEKFTATRDALLDMLERRPCTIEDIASGLNIHRNEAIKYVQELSARNQVKHSVSAGNTYYSVR